MSDIYKAIRDRHEIELTKKLVEIDRREKLTLRRVRILMIVAVILIVLYSIYQIYY